MLERHIVFENNTSYDIHETIRYIDEGYEPTRWVEFCIKDLMDCKFDTKMPEFINDPITGVLKQRNIWFAEYGIMHHVEIDNATIGTFSVTTVKTNTEECIEEEDEQKICAANALIEVGRREMIPTDIEFLHEEMEMDLDSLE